MTIFERLDLVWERLAMLTPGTWAYRYWSQVHAELFRKAMRR